VQTALQARISLSYDQTGFSTSHAAAPEIAAFVQGFNAVQTFNPRLFFRELIWKALLTRRIGQQRRPVFPKLIRGQVAITWIGHASFLIQFTDLNVLIDPNFANWLFF